MKPTQTFKWCFALVLIACIAAAAGAVRASSGDASTLSAMQRVAFVVEEFDPEDVGRLSGRFGAHWAASDGAKWSQGPQNVPVDDAVAWARREATVVVVRVGVDEEYSAGSTDLQDGIPPWPLDGMEIRPRPIDTPPDGSKQRVGWEAVVAVLGNGRTVADADKVRADLALSADVKRARVGSADDGSPVVYCTVLADGMASAMAVLNRLVVATPQGSGRRERTRYEPLITIRARAPQDDP